MTEHAETVRPCQFTYGSSWCAKKDARRYETHDGGEVWLCLHHRGWLPALGRAPEQSDGQGAGDG